MEETLNQFYIFDLTLDKAVLKHTALDKAGISARYITQVGNSPYTIPTLNEITKLIDGVSYRVDKNKLLSDIFECGAITISNKFDLAKFNEREKRYLQIINSYEPNERNLIVEVFSRIFALLTSVVFDNGTFNDWLGEIFMRSNAGNKHAGQFFTPYHVSKLMASIALDPDKVEEKRDTDGILTINEPCCGAGGMALATLNTLYNDYHFNYTRNCLLVCEDIDIRCVHMCYLQLSLAGASAIVKHQNTLTRETWSIWKTPSYVLQQSRFRQFDRELFA